MLIDFRTLFPKYNIKPKGVLHVGANVGEEAPVYLELGIDRQIWFEANVDIFNKLLANISNNPKAKAYNFAVSDETGIATLHVSNNGSQSSSILELGTHKIAHPEVHYIMDMSVSSIRLDHEPRVPNIEECDFINMDIQGAERTNSTTLLNVYPAKL